MDGISSLVFCKYYLEIFEASFCFLPYLCVPLVPFLRTAVLVSVFHGQHLSKTGVFLSCPLPSADQVVSSRNSGCVGEVGGPDGICPAPRSKTPDCVCTCPKRWLQSGILEARLDPPVLGIVIPHPLSYAWESRVSLVQPRQKAEIWPSARMGEQGQWLYPRAP